MHSGLSWLCTVGRRLICGAASRMAPLPRPRPPTADASSAAQLARLRCHAHRGSDPAQGGGIYRCLSRRGCAGALLAVHSVPSLRRILCAVPSALSRLRWRDTCGTQCSLCLTQVRYMVAALLEVGRRRIAPEEVTKILEASDSRGSPPPCVTARGATPKLLLQTTSSLAAPEESSKENVPNKDLSPRRAGRQK